MSGSFIPSNQSIAVTIFHASRVIDFDVYTRQGSDKPYLKCNLCESFIFLRADGTSPKMIEHWGGENFGKVGETTRKSA